MVEGKYDIAIPVEMLNSMKNGDNILSKDDWILRYTLNSAVTDDYDG